MSDTEAEKNLVALIETTIEKNLGKAIDKYMKDKKLSHVINENLPEHLATCKDPDCIVEKQIHEHIKNNYQICPECEEVIVKKGENCPNCQKEEEEEGWF